MKRRNAHNWQRPFSCTICRAEYKAARLDSLFCSAKCRQAFSRFRRGLSGGKPMHPYASRPGMILPRCYFGPIENLLVVWNEKPRK